MFKYIIEKLNIYKYYKKALQNNKSRWVVIVATTIIYFIVPIDLVPEFLLGPIGFIDDGVLLLVFVKESLSLIKNRNKN